MKKQVYINEIEQLVLKQMIKEVNKMLGQAKATSFLSTSLLLKFLPTFVAIQSDNAIVSKTSQLVDLDDNLNVYIPFSEPTVVVFELYYANKKSLKRLHNLAVKHTELFSFYYIKYMLAAVGQMTSTSFIQSKLSLVSGKANSFEIVSTAVDHYLNGEAIKVLQAAGYDTAFTDILDSTSNLDGHITQIASNYADLQHTKIPSYIRKLRLANGAHIDGELNTHSDHKPGQGQYSYQKGAAKANVVVDLSIQLTNTIASSCKGTGVGNLFATTFDTVSVNAEWFEDLARSLTSTIIEKSSEGYSSWGNLSKTKRHLYPSPIRISNDKKLDLVVFIDHSGSVSTGDLQKILGVFTGYSHLINRVTVMHHTSAVLQEITIEAEDIGQTPEFIQAFATRSGSGGTAHIDCFRRTQKLADKGKIDPDTTIILSFSDNFSDIEDTIHKYPVIKQMAKYWVRDNCGRDVNTRIAGGINIAMP